MLLTERVSGPRVLLLGGRNWKVLWVDWKRRRCFVEPSDLRGKARWFSAAIAGASHALSHACRDVLLGADPPVHLTRRAVVHLAKAREASLPTVHPGGTVILRDGSDLRWWTFSGYRANAVLTATLAGVTDEALPERLGLATLATRLADLPAASEALAENIRFIQEDV
ncbi:hypothetical protein [Spirillospora sp. CA-294931]|uniref:hypothetical protein n=1 Tax=Spirillospora sp. CA-294931 TaxID=3240042 RepID=UPI003D91C83B